MLNVATERGFLGDIIPNAAKQVKDRQQRYIEFALSNGWPEKPAGKVPALAATINALLVVEHLIPNSSLVGRATAFVFNQILNNDAGAHLKGWDWITLGRLAGRHHALSEAHSLKIASEVRELQTAVAHRELNRTSFNRIPREARTPSVYILTRGYTADIGILRQKPPGGSTHMRNGPLASAPKRTVRHRAIILTALRIERRSVLRHLNDVRRTNVRGTLFTEGDFGDWKIAVAEVGPGSTMSNQAVESPAGAFGIATVQLRVNCPVPAGVSL